LLDFARVNVAAAADDHVLRAVAPATGRSGAPRSRRTAYLSLSVEMTADSVSTTSAGGVSAAASPGVATSSRARESRAICVTSSGCSLALTGTAQSPAVQQANSISKNSAQ